MKDFLLQNYILIKLTVVFIAAFFGLLAFKYYRQTTVRYFIYFLIYVFVVEILSSYTRFLTKINMFHIIEDTVFKRNFWWHTLTWYIGSGIFLTWYYRKLIRSTFLKKILQFALILFILVSVITIGMNFQQFFVGTFNFIRLGNMSLIIICVAFYFYELLQSDQVLKFYRDINFYISSIILIWLLVTIPLVHFVCENADTDPYQAELKWMILLLANIFMYLLFAFALIFLKPKNDSTN